MGLIFLDGSIVVEDLNSELFQLNSLVCEPKWHWNADRELYWWKAVVLGRN